MFMTMITDISDLELVKLMYRYEQLKDEYEDFLQSDFRKELNKNGYNTPDMVEWVRTYREKGSAE